VAGPRYSSHGGLNKYIVYCDKHERWISWRKRNYFCKEKVLAKKGAPPVPSYCERFCECWGHLDNEAEVRCICYGFEKDCEKIGLW